VGRDSLSVGPSSTAAVDHDRGGKDRRVLVIPSEYPDPANPRHFNGNWTEEQTRAVARRYHVAVVYPVQAVSGRPGVEVHHSGGVSTWIVRYHHVRKSWLFSYAWAAVKGVRASGFRPHCIHAHGLYPAGLVALGLGRWLRRPVVVTEHWGRLDHRVRASRAMAALLRMTLRRATCVVAVSSSLAREMTSIEARCRPVVVPNTVWPRFFEVPLPSRKDTLESLRALFVGSIHDDRKGLADLLHALALRRRTPGHVAAHLTIIGDGSARRSCEELAARLGVQGSCSFLGNRSREEVVSAMRACDVLVVPSRYETFGVVYAEAMASGRPVVACSNGPAEEIVPSWAGILVPPGEPPAVAAALDSLAKGLASYDGARLRAYARSRFGPEAFLNRMASVYESAMELSH